MSSNHSEPLWNATDVVTKFPWKTVAILTFGLMSFVCFGGLCANLLSVCIYVHRSNRRSSVNILLAALSATDALLLLIALPGFAFGPLTYVYRGVVFDLMYKYIMLVFYPLNRIIRLASVWLLVLITVERYVAVCFPFNARHICTRKRAIALALTVLMFAILFDSVYFWDYESDPEDLVRPLLRANSVYLFWYANVATLLVEFLLPSLIMSVGTYRIVVGLRKARKDLVELELRRSVVQQEATAKMVVAVVLMFIACSTLSHVLNMVEICFPEFFISWFGHLITDINNLLVSFNSASSSIFYYHFSKRYRNHVHMLWKSIGNSRPSRPSTRRLRRRRNAMEIEMIEIPNHLRRTVI